MSFTYGADPSKVGLGLASSDLISVEIETINGSIYTFPDMGLEVLRGVLPPSGRIPTEMPSLCLVNIHASALAVPYLVIKEIRVEKETLWQRPSLDIRSK